MRANKEESDITLIQMQKKCVDFLQSDELNGKKVGLQCDFPLSSRRKIWSTRLTKDGVLGSKARCVDVKLWYCCKLA